MFNDDENKDPWFYGDSEEAELPAAGHPKIIPLQVLRDQALHIFDRMITEKSGLKSGEYVADLEAQSAFLSIEETEQIVRSFSAMDNGELMAVGGKSKAEAMDQVFKLMAALLDRIMSNVMTESSKRGLLDVSFDTDHNCFAFSLTPDGMKLVEENSHRFNEPGED